MAHWAIVITDERYEDEKLYHHDSLELTGAPFAAGDEVLVLAGAHPALVALGRVCQPDAGPAVLRYTHRIFEQPQPADELALDGALTRLDPASYRKVADRVAPPAEVTTWMVSLDLPIEASSPAEAVRQFWSYVAQLGPRELPAYVWPAGQELAMQAFVLGQETNLDPEEDE